MNFHFLSFKIEDTNVGPSKIGDVQIIRPWSAQNNVAHSHGTNITPQLVLIGRKL